MTKLRLLLGALLVAITPAHALAAVEISFYSKELGASFPHAFVRLEGRLDRGGPPIDANYGFTAKHISPAVLMGSVTGEIISADPDYVGRSDRHFTVALSDAEYDAVMATVARWGAYKQPSYNLNRRNCVFFVADVAATLGMVADTPPALMKKPRSYTEALAKANRQWLTRRKALPGEEAEAVRAAR